MPSSGELADAFADSAYGRFVMSRKLLKAPAVEIDEAKRRRFADLLAATSQGGVIDYHDEAPKSEFLVWCAEEEGLLCHGANRADIDTFTPRPQTDWYSRRVTAVFAASDGIWPMFFAVLDRSRYRGSLRNGCVRFTLGPLASQKRYWFSLNGSARTSQPWTAGTVYLLARDGFRPTSPLLGMCPQEWSTTEPVRPIARLHVDPEDFPFLNHIGEHREYHELPTMIRAARDARRRLRPRTPR